MAEIIEKLPGEPVGANLKMFHQGPKIWAWVGFGIGPGQQDPVSMKKEQFIGGWVEVPQHNTWTEMTIDVNGIFPDGFRPGEHLNTNKMVCAGEPPYTAARFAKYPDGERFADDWDQEVFVVPVSKFNIKDVESTYF